MRAWAVLVVAMGVAGCPQEPPRCSCIAPELRLVWLGSDGLLIAGDSGDVPLDPVTRGCSSQSRLRIQNVGLAAARFSASTNSPSVTVLNAPGTLDPGEEQALDLLISARFEQSSLVEAGLTIELEGRPALHFNLQSLVVTGDWELPGPFDFGGVEVGATRGLPGPSLRNLSGDFSMSNGELQFSPRALGPQVLAAAPSFGLNCPDLHVTLMGDGVEAVLTGPAAISFGDVTIGTSRDLDLLLQNFSYDEVQFAQLGGDFEIASSSAAPSVATRDPSGALVAGHRSIRLRFTPGSSGPQASDLHVTAGSSALTIPVRANGVP